MNGLFQSVLGLSWKGGLLIMAVLLLRLVLRKAPRRTVCLLWLLVGLRLLVPFEIVSSLSLQPALETVPLVSTVADAVPEDTGWENEPVEMPDNVEVDDVVAKRGRAAYLWAAVALAMGCYGLWSYVRLRRRVREAICVSPGVYEYPGLETAFLLGYLNPRIYLPAGLQDAAPVLAHERTHIRRGDHWWKLLGYVVLTVHWFNPLVWLAYGLLCRDLEMACDEAMIREMDLPQRKAYSAALLACAARSSMGVCPVAFGEVSVKQRIEGVMNYKKPRFWLCLLGAAAVVFAAVCFLTNPQNQDLATCRRALKAFQRQEVQHVVMESTAEGNYHLGKGTTKGEFWLCGEDWLRTAEDGSDEGRTFAWMYVDGCGYERYWEDGVPFWKPQEEHLLPDRMWLYTFDLDAQPLELVEHEVTDEAEMFEFRCENGDIVTFWLMNEKLDRVEWVTVLTTRVDQEFLASRTTVLMTIVPTTKEEAAAVIAAQ